MLEPLTLYRHADYVHDPEYHVNGVITNIDTTREPEYSKDLRDLIKRCIEPDPFNRIPLDRLRASIRSYRKRISRVYRESDEEEKARFRSDNRLYYIRNESTTCLRGIGNLTKRKVHRSPNLENSPTVISQLYFLVSTMVLKGREMRAMTVMLMMLHDLGH